jgi:hypothetical protein
MPMPKLLLLSRVELEVFDDEGNYIIMKQDHAFCWKEGVGPPF